MRKPVPNGVELAWSGREQGPGPKPGFELDDVIDAAIGLADRHGLADVSLAAVAKVLNCATTALYRYVPSKADLLILMRDRALAPPDLVSSPGLGWPDRLRVVAEELFTVVLGHPWTLDVPSSGPSTTPNELAWGEHILHTLTATSLAPVERLRVVTLVVGYVREQARMVTAMNRPGLDTHGTTDPVTLLRTFITAQRYPAFADILASGALDAPAAYTDEEFAFGLDRIIDGITALDNA